MNSNTIDNNNSENDHSSSSIQDDGVNVDHRPSAEEQNEPRSMVVGTNRIIINRSDSIMDAREERPHLVDASLPTPPYSGQHQPISSHQFVLGRTEPTIPARHHGRRVMIESSFNADTLSPHHAAANSTSRNTKQRRIASIIDEALLVSSSSSAPMLPAVVSPTTSLNNSTLSMVNFLDLASLVQPPRFASPGSCYDGRVSSDNSRR